MPRPEVQHRIVLTRHEVTPAPGVLSVAATVSRADGILSIGYVVEGDIDRLNVPAAGPIRRGHYLWQHTCFELFIRVRGAGSYHELNFAPSCEWDAYAFTRYRDGAVLESGDVKPEVRVLREAERLATDVRIELGALGAEYVSSPLSMGLSAVLESRQGALTYWALAHAAVQPDFHHERSFALDLA